MMESRHPAFEAELLTFTSTTNNSGSFLRCWKQPSCTKCLEQVGCGWCPYTWACVPDDASMPILAPIHANICPHPDERWELRTRPLGCNVSTRNFLSVVVAVLSTVLLALLLWGLVASIKACVRLSRQDSRWYRDMGWGIRERLPRSWRWGKDSGETAPLLAGGSSRGA